ncbi:Hypothetical protein Cp226_1321 [Corynebacterium pseudotuberculosis]|nr:Hypothetical protein Cp226_1321 [Corynebacterium pseudotuberculosis]
METKKIFWRQLRKVGGKIHGKHMVNAKVLYKVRALGDRP